MLDDEAGETAAMFVARLVPDPGTDLGALAAVVQHFLDIHCDAPPPHGVGGYIWDREAPMLHTDDDDDHVLLLDMRVQGCVDDEWFLTYLLRELSRMHALCISVEDEDGEFLLIEAADELPKWVRPDNATHRVWIAGGALHLIPPASAPLDQPLSVAAATAIVRDAEQTTRAPSEVEQAAFARLAAYPQAAIDHHHYTLAYLPNTAAKVFASHPQWVSDAVHMLVTRDVVSARLTQPLTYFPVAMDDASSVPAPELVRVRMTRHLYARLCMERFFPAKSFGRAWQRQVELYRLALSGQDASISEHDQHHGRWFDMGAKLTSGLEMWVHHLQSQSVYTHSPDPLPLPEERARLVASLTRLGYFGNEIPGSAQWQALEAQALRIAAQQPSAGRAHDTMRTLQRIQAAIKAPADEHVYTLSPQRDTATLRSHEDSDAWMNEAPEDVDALLSQHGADSAEDATLDRFQLFMNKMQTFIDSQGDMEGALFEDDDWEDSTSESEDEVREQRMQSLVEPVPAHEWGARNAAADSCAEGPASRPLVSEPSPARAAKSVARPAPQRLEGLTRLEPLEGESDSDRESLPGDDDDAPEERAERHSMLGMHEPGPQADEAAVVDEDGPVEQDMDDFLAFTRRTLGLTDVQYANILQERRERGGTCPY